MNRPMNRLLPLFVALACVLLTPAARADDPEPTVTLQDALATLEEGIERLERRDDEAKTTIARAASQLEAVIERENLRTPSAYHALGNAYALLDDYGHAVLAYRRGLDIDPRNPRLRDSLEFARQQVQISVQPSAANRVRKLLTAWRGYVSRRWLWLAFVSLFVLGWTLLIVRILAHAPGALRAAALWCFALALLPITALGYEWYLTRGVENIVITQPEVMAMTGPDDSIYDPAYTEPLHAGVEGVVEETRDGWARVRLIDGSECWVPQDAYEPVTVRKPTENG